MALWTPASITTALWLRTNALTAGSLTTWSDESGNSRNAAEATNPPTTVESVLNGLPIVRFNGTNNKLGISGYRFGDGATTTTLSIFVLGAQTSGTNGVFLSTRSDNPQGWSLRNNNTTELTYYHVGSSPNLTRASPTGFFLAEVLRVGNSIQLGVDGTFNAPASISGYLNTGYNATSIGAETNATSSFLTGDVAEIIIVEDLVSDATRTIIEGYMMHKAGLEANLPSGHPFKNGAPAVGTVNVKDKNGTNASGRLVISYSADGALVDSATTDGSGNCSIIFPAGSNYIVVGGESDRNDLIYADVTA